MFRAGIFSYDMIVSAREELVCSRGLSSAFWRSEGGTGILSLLFDPPIGPVYNWYTKVDPELGKSLLNPLGELRLRSRPLQSAAKLILGC